MKIIKFFIKASIYIFLLLLGGVMFIPARLDAIKFRGTSEGLGGELFVIFIPLAILLLLKDRHLDDKKHK
jgi:hypothetical protein